MHDREYELARPILSAHPDAEWLTVGDGGGDAWWLRKQGAKVTGSSISLSHLKRFGALLDGIPLLEINAEAIDLPDGATDYVLCKASFHHFPRPMIAFYEFLRVARQGMLLIEPTEFGPGRPLDVVRKVVKRLLRGESFGAQEFETTGNYIYRVSIRETYRALCAIQSPWFAVKPYNSFFGCGINGRSRHSPLYSTIYRMALVTQDLLCRLGLMRPALAAVFVPTGASDPATRAALKRDGYHIIDIPRNPYLSPVEP